jgi:hypothetical protein
MRCEKRSIWKLKGDKIYGCSKKVFLENLAVTWLDINFMLL